MDETAKRGVKRTILSKWAGVVVAVLAVAVTSGVIAILVSYVSSSYLLVLYVLAVLGVAIGWGTGLAVFTAVLSVVAFSYLFLGSPFPFHLEDPSNIVGTAVFLATAVIVGQLATRLRNAALESASLSREQYALRRIATLVAQSTPSSTIFEAVTREVGLLCSADLARMERYEADGTVTGVAAWSRVPAELRVGTQFALVGPSIAREVQASGGPARVETFSGATGEIANEARSIGIRSSVGCPITVAGYLWGVIAASTKSHEPFPANTESQIAKFTELVATAVANAFSREELAASRARVVAASDQTRLRLERNLHDGAQQRLVSLALRLRMTREEVPAELASVRADLDRATEELVECVEDLREIAHGLHPPILSKGGLAPALRTLARRSAVPMDVHIETESRYPPTVEVAAYYAVSEALTNTARYAAASRAELSVAEQDGALRVTARDNGKGGADARRGSGLTGLRDRIEALGGTIEILSPVGQGTTINVLLPIDHKSAEEARL